jgi:urocanate hydratase
MSSGSSSLTFTPAMTASSTSAPEAIIANAFSTQVSLPPFRYWLPLAEQMTSGLALFGVMTAGAWPNARAGAAAAAATAAPA